MRHPSPQGHDPLPHPLHHHIIGTAPITHQTKYQIQKKKKTGGWGEEERLPPPPLPPPDHLPHPLHHHIIGTAPITHQTKYQIQKKNGGGGAEERTHPHPPPVEGYCSHDHKITMDFGGLETKNSVQSISAHVSKYFLCQVFVVVVVLFFVLLSSVCLFFFVTTYDLFYNCRTTGDRCTAKLHYLRTRNVQTKSQHQSQARRGKLPQSSVGLAE